MAVELAVLPDRARRTAHLRVCAREAPVGPEAMTMRAKEFHRYDAAHVVAKAVARFDAGRIDATGIRDRGDFTGPCDLVSLGWLKDHAPSGMEFGATNDDLAWLEAVDDAAFDHGIRRYRNYHTRPGYDEPHLAFIRPARTASRRAHPFDLYGSPGTVPQIVGRGLAGLAQGEAIIGRGIDGDRAEIVYCGDRRRCGYDDRDLYRAEAFDDDLDRSAAVAGLRVRDYGREYPNRIDLERPVQGISRRRSCSCTPRRTTTRTKRRSRQSR